MVLPYRHCIYLLQAESVYCIDFLGRKINLSGVSPAKRSRSGPNSVYVDRSKGDNVQIILGAIGPFWPKWRLGLFPRSQSLFCLVNHATFRQLRNGRFSRNWSRNVVRCPVAESGKTFSKLFTLRGICPQNLKSKKGQTGTSLRTAYRSEDALQRDTVYSAL